MNEAYNDAIARLDRDYPPPKQALSLRELCDVFGLVLKTVQNKNSEGKLGFPVISVGGKVTVSKVTVAKLLAELDPFEDVNPKVKVLDDVPPPPRRGRPRNSPGLQRFAMLEINRILDATLDDERSEFLNAIREVNPSPVIRINTRL
jgi:hypothetical protein